jgi:methylaspartate mutase sigma subunit
MKKLNIETGMAPLAIVATTPDDSHGWNLIGVTMRLEERGFAVENLGPCTPSDLLAQRIRDKRPSLVVLSSVNGHGALSLPSVLETLEQYQVRRLAPIVVGGLLTTNPALLPDAAIQLRQAGIAAVFAGDDAWTEFDRFLAECCGNLESNEACCLGI